MNFHTENALSENAMFHQDSTPGYYGGPCPMFILGSFTRKTFPLLYTIFDRKGNPFTILGDPGAPRTVGQSRQLVGTTRLSFQAKVLVVNFFPKIP